MNPVRQMLPRAYFLEALFQEKMRVERSRRELSLILIHLAESLTVEDPVIKPLLDNVLQTTRLSDRIGVLDRGIIALLLPDTGVSGAEDVARNIGKQLGERHTRLMIVTYPDSVFEQLCSTVIASRPSLRLLAGAGETHKTHHLAYKRGMDIVGGLFGLIILLPLMLIIAFLIRLTSEGDVFFRQTRLGKNGVPFTLLKFRSMYADSREHIHQDYVTRFIQGASPESDIKPEETHFYKLTRDPRITPLGRWLRKSSLDELPQLINVIKGDMSLVGPRPAIGYEAQQYQAWHLRRILSMKPGITGLWQVEGRSQTRFDDMVRMDIRYIQNWTLWLDIRILWKTLPAVIRGTGAA